MGTTVEPILKGLHELSTASGSGTMGASRGTLQTSSKDQAPCRPGLGDSEGKVSSGRGFMGAPIEPILKGRQRHEVCSGAAVL